MTTNNENKIKTIDDAKRAFDACNTLTKNAITQNVKREYINDAIRVARDHATRSFNDMNKNDVLNMIYTSMLNVE